MLQLFYAYPKYEKHKQQDYKISELMHKLQ